MFRVSFYSEVLVLVATKTYFFVSSCFLSGSNTSFYEDASVLDIFCAGSFSSSQGDKC